MLKVQFIKVSPFSISFLDNSNFAKNLHSLNSNLFIYLFKDISSLKVQFSNFKELFICSNTIFLGLYLAKPCDSNLGNTTFFIANKICLESYFS